MKGAKDNKMSLWNTIKSWFKSEEPVTEKDLVSPEPKSHQTATELFEQMCLESGINPLQLAKSNAVRLFSEWYDGPADRQQIAEVYPEFKQAHAIVQKKLGDTVVK